MELATYQPIYSIVDETKKKIEGIDQLLNDFDQAIDVLKMGTCVAGVYSGNAFRRQIHTPPRFRHQA